MNFSKVLSLSALFSVAAQLSAMETTVTVAAQAANEAPKVVAVAVEAAKPVAVTVASETAKVVVTQAPAVSAAAQAASNVVVSNAPKVVQPGLIARIGASLTSLKNAGVTNVKALANNSVAKFNSCKATFNSWPRGKQVAVVAAVAAATAVVGYGIYKYVKAEKTHTKKRK